MKNKTQKEFEIIKQLILKKVKQSSAITINPQQCLRVNFSFEICNISEKPLDSFSMIEQ